MLVASRRPDHSRPLQVVARRCLTVSRPLRMNRLERGEMHGPAGWSESWSDISRPRLATVARLFEGRGDGESVVDLPAERTQLALHLGLRLRHGGRAGLSAGLGDPQPLAPLWVTAAWQRSAL